MSSVGQELLDVPFAEMVLQLAKAIAEGQYELDKVSCEIAQFMGDKSKAAVYLPDPTSDDADASIETSMIGAGFQPTFYQFTDTIVEVKIAITITKSTEAKVSAKAKAGFGCFSASVNASYSSKYSYSAEGASLLRTKITPLPPNPILQKLIELKAATQQKEIEQKIETAEKKESEDA